MKAPFLWFLCQLTLVALALAAATTLYLLDCGPHGREMQQYIAEEHWNGTLVFMNTSLTEPPECRNQSNLEWLFINLLWNITLPARVSLSLGSYTTNYWSRPLHLLLDRGVEVYAATGNDGLDGCWWPASQDRVRAIGHPGGNRCLNKTDPPPIRVDGACSSSEATARAAARGANESFSIPWRYCDNEWQWYFMSAMVGTFGCVTGVTVALLLVRLFQPRANASEHQVAAQVC
jgi:hypothetical protein